SGYVLHEAGHGQEIIPVMVDLDRVHAERESGLRGLGQPLKSFRDRSVDFSVYDRARFASHYLASLGPLAKPGTALGNDAVSTPNDGEQGYVNRTGVGRNPPD